MLTDFVGTSSSKQFALSRPESRGWARMIALYSIKNCQIYFIHVPRCYLGKSKRVTLLRRDDTTLWRRILAKIANASSRLD
eukprot:scaffold64398_cov41-Prasinocladus_malaysianus.AAC.1